MNIEPFGPPGMQNLDRIRSCACPLVFDTENADAPFSVYGSGFLVKFRDHRLLLTAEHSVGEADPKQIIVYPSGRYAQIRTRRRWIIEQNPDDPDSTDVAIVELDPTAVTPEVETICRVVNLSPDQINSWRSDRSWSSFFLFGYPAVINTANYATSTIQSAQVLLHGRYVAAWGNGCCHELRVENPHQLADFNGFSGSPVFCCVDSDSPQPARFCGMALRGSPGSNAVHFLGADRILQLLELL